MKNGLLNKILIYTILLFPIIIFIIYINRFPLLLPKYFAYFFSQFNPNEFVFPIHLVREIVFIVWFTFNSVMLGVFVIYGLNMKPSLKEELFAISFPIGFLIQSMLVFLLGIVGLLFSSVLYVMMILISGISIYLLLKNNFKILKQFKESPSSFSSIPVRLKIFGVIILISVLAIIFLSASTPPIQSDGIRYHLTAPQEYLKSHRLHYIPNNAYTNLPFVVEMNFLIAMGTFGDLEAQCVHVLCLIFSMILIYVFILNITKNPTLSFLGSLLYLSIPSATIISSWPFIDQGIIMFFIFHLFILIKIYDYLRGIDGSQNGESKTLGSLIVLSGISMGGLLGTKYTMVVVWLFSGLILSVMMLIYKRNANNLKFIVQKVFLYFLISFIIFSPWLIKNIYYTGNPVYFLMNSVFKGGEWTDESAKFLASKMAEKGVGKSLKNFITGTYDLTFKWWLYEHFNPGPIPLMLVIFVLMSLIKVVPKYSAEPAELSSNQFKCVIIFLYLFLSYGVWFFSYQGGRFFMSCIALIIILGMTGAYNLFHFCKSEFINKIFISVIFCGVIYSSLWSIRYICNETNPPTLPVALGFQTRDDFLKSALNYYNCALFANAQVLPPSKILLVGEHRGYYFKCDYVASDWFDSPMLLSFIRKTKNNEDLFSLLKRMNIDYVFFNFDELSKYREAYYRTRFSPEEYERVVAFEKSDKFKILFNDGGNKIIAKIIK